MVASDRQHHEGFLSVAGHFLPRPLYVWGFLQVVAFFGFLRSAELTVPSLVSFCSSWHLEVKDIEMDSATSPTCMHVRIKASKTDPFLEGCLVHIGLAAPPLCVVQSMMLYLGRRGNSPGPLFLLQSGQPLTRSLLTSWLCDIFLAVGIAGNFSCHSFRIGAATVATCSGIPDHQIQALCYWSSKIFQLYIHFPVDILARLSSRLVSQ